ncbi:GIY-YIG nuclease family protein [Paludibacter sp.]|uniref:GIY-YIG nuclease family protein n=1 Tax=Paludibacter sp. TaxID=1898105 RepID=UPI001352585B|nr:GIY-YIG nuclease family protein [Paludibacter sp.]MTK53357.1 GIY-YIG nuclease family protein [Paludibacter sp.]
MYNLNSIPIVKYDNFLKSKHITWSSVGGRVEDYPQYDFGDSIICNFDERFNLIFSFRYYDNKIYLVLKFKPKDYKLNINDSVNFLFENDTLLNYTISNEPYKGGVYYESDGSKSTFVNYFETLIQISMSDLEIFSTYKLCNYALNLKSYKLIGGNRENGAFWHAGRNYNSNDPIKSKAVFQEALRLFASTFIDVINQEVPDYIETTISSTDETCYVYLMHDLKTNFYKIGISNSPSYREKTLQSEKPTIILMRCKRFPKRKIAEILEKTLHSTYSNKRIRGEWFSLDTEDTNDISQILND